MKNKISNFSLFSVAIIISGLIVIVSSVLKISEKHNERLLYAMHSKVEYKAKRCYLENNCAGEITLKNLYERNYLTEVVNPVTKEILDGSLTINYIDNKVIINWE